MYSLKTVDCIAEYTSDAHVQPCLTQMYVGVTQPWIYSLSLRTIIHSTSLCFAFNKIFKPTASSSTADCLTQAVPNIHEHCAGAAAEGGNPPPQ